MVSIDAALSRIKEDWRKVLSVAHIEAACRAAELRWRKRILDPASTILIFFLQVLHHNTAITNLPRLAGKRFTPGAYCQARARIPLAALRRLLHETGMPLREPLQKGGTAGATRFDSLRSCSPRSGAARSSAKSSGAARSSSARSAAGGAGGTATANAGLWLGHRVFLLDGSSCSMRCDTCAGRCRTITRTGMKTRTGIRTRTERKMRTRMKTCTRMENRRPC